MNVAGTSVEPLLVWKQNHSLRDAADFALSTAASIARLGSGAYVAHVGKRPARRLELYEMEGCPFSRKVREALSILDLDAIIHPCPEGGRRFRNKVEALLGNFQIPVLVDANVDGQKDPRVLTESDAIVKYLFTTYGDGKVPLPLRSPKLATLSSKLASRIRGERGQHAEKHSYEPEGLLELYGYEASPYSRIVRETLCRLEIPYVLHNLARGSEKRDAFVAMTGKLQFPFLYDPAAHTAGMFESKEIVRYLEDRYGAERPKS